MSDFRTIPFSSGSSGRCVSGIPVRGRHFFLQAERTPETAGRNGKWYTLMQEKELSGGKGIITYQLDDIQYLLVQDV